MIDLHPHAPSHPLTLADQLAFREGRRDGLYSTDSPAIIGLSRFGTALSVYREKVEPVPEPEPVSLKAWLGWRLESSLALLYGERYEVDVHQATGTYTLAEQPHIKTHLDFIDALGVVVECKTRDHFSSDWGDDGTSKVPVEVWVQVQHEMLVTGAELARVAVLFGLRTFRVYELHRDDVFLGKLVPKLGAFWDDVLARRQPEYTGHPVDTEYAKRHKQAKGEPLRAATPNQEKLMERLRMAKLVVSQAEQAKEELENRIREMIGTAAGLQGRFGKVTWNTTRDRVDHEQVAGAYRGMAEELLEMAAPGDDPELVARLGHIQQLFPLVEGLYTTPGYRRLDVRLSEWRSDGDE